MRLDAQHIERLKRVAVEEAGQHARLRLFGSRLDDAATGGDVDLLLELSTPVAEPAVLVARMAARASRVRWTWYWPRPISSACRFTMQLFDMASCCDARRRLAESARFLVRR